MSEQDMRKLLENRRTVRGGVGGGAIERDSPNGAHLDSRACRPKRNSQELVANPAPSPLPGWPKCQFTLNGQLQSGKNRVLITRTGKRYAPKRFVQWREAMLKQMSGLLAKPLRGPVSMTANYIPGDKIQRDVDGMLSALLHVLVKAGLLLDDSQIKAVQWLECAMDREHPRCSISLLQLGSSVDVTENS